MKDEDKDEDMSTFYDPPAKDGKEKASVAEEPTVQRTLGWVVAHEELANEFAKKAQEAYIRGEDVLANVYRKLYLDLKQRAEQMRKTAPELAAYR